MIKIGEIYLVKYMGNIHKIKVVDVTKTSYEYEFIKSGYSEFILKEDFNSKFTIIEKLSSENNLLFD